MSRIVTPAEIHAAETHAGNLAAATEAAVKEHHIAASRAVFAAMIAPYLMRLVAGEKDPETLEPLKIDLEYCRRISDYAMQGAGFFCEGFGMGKVEQVEQK